MWYHLMFILLFLLLRTQKVEGNRAFRQRVKDVGASSLVPAAGPIRKKTADEYNAISVSQLEVEEVSVTVELFYIINYILVKFVTF